MKNKIVKFNTIMLSTLLSVTCVAQATSGTNFGNVALAKSDVARKNTVNRMRIEVIDSSGGVNGGGGVSGSDAKGNRRLLDLLEKDELEYFYPSTVTPSMTSIVDRLMDIRESYFAAVKNPDLNPRTQKYINENLILGEPAFAFSFLLAIYPSKMLLNPGSEFWVASNIQPVEPLKWAFVDVELEKINDVGLVRFENEKTRRQVAIQKDGLVIVSRAEFNLLDEESRIALYIHEATLRVVLSLNPDNIVNRGTQDVRVFTRRLYRYITSKGATPGFPVREAYEAFQIIDKSKFWDGQWN